MDWRDRAACRGHDPELFFPVGQGVAAAESTRRATAICRDCLVRQQCLHWALDRGEDAGIWGGLTQDERADLTPRSRQRTSNIW